MQTTISCYWQNLPFFSKMGVGLWKTTFVENFAWWRTFFMSLFCCGQDCLSNCIFLYNWHLDWYVSLIFQVKKWINLSHHLSYFFAHFILLCEIQTLNTNTLGYNFMSYDWTYQKYLIRQGKIINYECKQQ